MHRTRLVCSIALGSLALCTAALLAQDTKKNHTPPPTATPAQAATPPESQLPPGMTPEMMQQMMEAATPGPMQAYLCEDIGEWVGACSMWMSPNATPTTSKSSMNVRSVLGGRFIHQEAKGDMGEWGLFEGFGMVGFDNAKGEFQATWADSMGTGMMYGTGSLSSDKKVLTINYTYYCPMSKKNCAFRQSYTRNDNGTKTMRLWGASAETGEEYKMMETIYARTHTPPTHATHTDGKDNAH